MYSRKRDTLLVVSLLALLLIIVACATEPIAPVTAQTAEPAPQVAPKQEVVAPKPEPAKPASPYAVEVTPLTTTDCARCHLSIFEQIKKEGGKHKIDCTQCHTVYHAYNPVQQNWQQIMPKCQTCHGMIHGDKFASCLACHSNPHAPKTQMAMTPEFGKACAECHAKVGQVMQNSPSKHMQVQCMQCHHDKHGYIPSCMECHKPHTPTLTVKECLACHPAHTPLKISYAITTPNNICGSCHSTAYQKLEANQSKHHLLACASCHTKHGFIPKCEDCHSKVHGEALLKKFPNCSQCHGSAHDLPSRSSVK